MDVQLTCCVCGAPVSRRLGEHNRNSKLGRRVYCSRRCCGGDNLGNIPKEKIRSFKQMGVVRWADELAPFRYHMKNIKSRERERGFDAPVITPADLRDLWEAQAGRCPYTGWLLKTPRTSNVSGMPVTPDRASVDRIDSSKRYTLDNIQFVSFMAQMAKHAFSEDDLLRFCKAVVDHRKL